MNPMMPGSYPGYPPQQPYGAMPGMPPVSGYPQGFGVPGMPPTGGNTMNPMMMPSAGHHYPSAAQQQGHSHPQHRYPASASATVPMGMAMSGAAAANSPQRCNFFQRMGACRHGDGCTKLHLCPPRSPTVLFPMLYPNPRAVTHLTDREWKPFDEKYLKNHFFKFYKKFWTGMMAFGKISEMHVVSNLCDHLLGNVYVKFQDPATAAEVVRSMEKGRLLEKKLLMLPRLCPVTDFAEACCKDDREGTCTRELGNCNYLHLLKISRTLKKKLEKKQKKYWDKKLANMTGAAVATGAPTTTTTTTTTTTGAVPPHMHQHPTAPLPTAPSGIMPPPTTTTATVTTSTAEGDRHNKDRERDRDKDRSRGRERERERDRDRDRHERDRSRHHHRDKRDKDRSRGRDRDRHDKEYKSGRKRERSSSRGRRRNDDQPCYICNKIGHLARDCKRN